MNREKVIVRQMVNEYPLTIAKKNYYKDKTYPTFDGWAENGDEPGTQGYKIAKKSEKLMKDNPFAFILGCQFDRLRLTWMAWRSPFLLASHDEIGIKNMTPKFFSKIHGTKLAKILRKKKLGAHFVSHANAAKLIKQLSKHIVDVHNGRAQEIWEKAKTFPDLLDRIEKLPGFGVNLTNMLVKILIEYGMIPQIPKTKKAKRGLQVKADIHVKRVFYRAGLSKLQTEKAAMAAAKDHMPSFPMSLDTAGYMIGIKFCKATAPLCKKCIIFKKRDAEVLCKRRGI